MQVSLKVVLIKRSLLFIFGIFGQVLNGFYEAARMAVQSIVYVHLLYRALEKLVRAQNNNNTAFDS